MNIIDINNGPEARKLAEQAFFECAMEMPEGYTRCGVAIREKGGPRLFIAGVDVPAMFWTGGEWERVVPLTDG